MEDFEYSVEISDRDWDCFFAECEECSLLPPSLARLDDSGLSDIDDTGSILSKKAQGVDPKAGFSEVDHPIDGPPDCEGSPVEHYLSKHTIGGMESVLSGSEEDIHLQSVNIFFERLKNLTEAEGLTEPSQVRAGKNREATQEEERCSDGQQASSCSLPRNIPKLNSLPASGGTAVGRESTGSVDTISNINTMKKDVPGSNISPELAASNLVLETNKSTYPETRLFIREEACTETRVNEATQLNQSHDSPEGVVCSETTPHTDMVIKVEMCPPLDDVKQKDLLSHLTLGKKYSTDSSSNLEMVTNVKWKEDQYPDVFQSDATCTSKSASQESSPTGSIKRKRRKKRRLSAEPAEGVHGYDRQGFVKYSDSEEEPHAWRGETSHCLSEEINLSHLNEPQKNVTSSLTPYLATSNLPVKTSVEEHKINDLSHFSMACDSQYHYLPESIVREGGCKATGLAENNATNDRSVIPLSETGYSLMSAPNNSDNVARNLFALSTADSVTGKSDLATETANCGGKDVHSGSLQQSDKMNHPIICCENEQKSESCTAEVKSMSILPSTKSNDPAMEVSQHGKISAAKSVLAAEAGNSGRDNCTLCQREGEPQQQLEIGCQDRDRYRSTLEKTDFPLSASSSDAYNTKPKQFKYVTYPFLDISSKADCAKLALDTSSALPDKHCLTKSPPGSDIYVTAQQTEHPNTLSSSDVLSEKKTTDERFEFAASQIMAFISGNSSQSGEINQTGKSQRGTKSSMSEDVLTSVSDFTSVSSCCTLDTESFMSLSNESIIDMSESCLSVKQNDPEEEKASLILAKHEEGDGISESKSQSASNDATDSKCGVVVKAEHVITASKAECELVKAPDSKHSVFAMSSFWSEMEKLTINDILGLRMISKAAPPSLLPSLQESEESDTLAMTDSGFFTQLDESKPEQIDEDMSGNLNSVESSPVIAVGSSSSGDVTWESLSADIYTENMMLTSLRDISQPLLPGGVQTGPRKISKNVSVHDLHALASDSFSFTRKGPSIQTLNEGELQKGESFTDGDMPKQDKDGDSLASSSTDSYKISLTDIFQYLFSGKQSVPSQSATDNITNSYTDGNSVPETYDYFFSDFDTESFFYPLISAERQTKNELVPIFSYSRSTNRNLQFPEAYDHFFASSSSDDSSVESDEEDSCGPVKVVTRLSHISNASQVSTDVYDNFFTDSDLRQNFFWKNTFSFRNVGFTGSAVQKKTLSPPLACVPGKQSARSLRRTMYPMNALGNQDRIFPDPLLLHLDESIYRQLAQQPFKYEDLQMAVSNPRLDASLLPLRQSDMCLVCIAFASWVLKTANPQVGDAWKAVLLANVSALSAIRYLRKYVKKEAAASEKKLEYPALSDS
ncbi:PGC-1 and ERR-induced regulator in muscle protein 1 [Epinephelus fuscoguttatus]|uniref:PGC-1 and ERR-induced regulator in muscle protein 1 n=1 Tax=Epinephelus fuscoguttatus TaxID=293821 RepID=UPI0020D1C5E7|nr:PGC-1 and ERR-induced regulator in muscle protein 1 [Epinephelus fuscoguttatus]